MWCDDKNTELAVKMAYHKKRIEMLEKVTQNNVHSTKYTQTQAQPANEKR